MAVFQWIVSILGGLMWNWVFLKKMCKVSIVEIKVLQFIKGEFGFGWKMGEIIIIVCARNLLDIVLSVLLWNGKILVDQMFIVQMQIILQKFGWVVEFDEDMVVLLVFDLNDFIQGVLIKCMKFFLDVMVFGVFKGCQICFVLQSVS